jgi:hypothetical protein
MLEPRDRVLFPEALRPPPGYTVDCAVGTTYTLDLLALVSVPLAFTLYDWCDDESREASPLALLEAVRRNADRIALFCQDDRIAIPRQYRGLFAYIEPSVVPVRPPEGGSFHPKVWAVRYESPGLPVRYRLLVLSRNLTFDRSWDTLLALEGELTDRKYAYSRNHPLGDFFVSLGEMAATPLSARIARQLDQIQAELRRVRFQLPEGFEDIVFWPLGIRGYRSWPFQGKRIDRMLVISRFLAEGCLRRLASPGRENILISDVEALAAVDRDALSNFSRVLVLQDGLEPEPEEDADWSEDGASADEDGHGVPAAPLTGLHAKVYVADRGWKAHVWTGSANATESAFRDNVEFMVELVGKKSRCGIDALLQGEGEGLGLGALLREYEPGERVPEDPEKVQLEKRLEEARRALADAGLVASVAGAAAPGEYTLALTLPQHGQLDLPAGIAVSCRPITMREWRALEIPAKGAPQGRALATFGPLSLEALTPFFAFELVAAGDGLKLSTGFVLMLPLEGEPEGRRERVLLSVLRDRDQVRRYLFLLLAEVASSPGEALAVFQALSGTRPNGAVAPADFPLLETMVRALHRSPDSLDRVAELIEDLRRTPEGRELLPEGLEAVWDPIWAARRLLRGTSAT